MLPIRRVFTVVAFTSAASVIILLTSSRISSANRDREQLAALSESIKLGSDSADVIRECGTASAKHKWAFIPAISSVSLPTCCVETPLRLGATNWVLYVSFIDNKTAAIMVRTSDTPRSIPGGAPLDRIQEQARDFVKKEFTP